MKKSIFKNLNGLMMAVVALSVLYMNSCSDSEDPIDMTDQNETGMTYLTINLTDSPGDYQQVNIDVQQIRVQLMDSTWRDLTTNSGFYDLLTLQNGVDTTIVKDSLSKGTYITQLRMVLGDSNTIMVDSMIYKLKVPSGSTSGFKVNFADSLAADSLGITLDFDAGKSIHEIKRGEEYILRPVIKVK